MGGWAVRGTVGRVHILAICLRKPTGCPVLGYESVLQVNGGGSYEVISGGQVPVHHGHVQSVVQRD